MDYSTTALVAKLKLWGAVPTNQPAFTAAQFLDILTDELTTVIAPLIVQLREEWFVTSSDTAITSGTTEYDIPSRALGGILRDVKFVGNDDIEQDLPRIDPNHTQNHRRGFWVQGNKLKLINNDDFTTYTLRMYYYVRQPILVAETSCAKVSSVGTTTFEVTSIPSNLTSGDTVDITGATPPFELKAKDITATWVGTTVTPSTMPSDLAVGDYMSTAQESCIARIPVEMIPLLIQSGVIRMNEIFADSKGLKQAIEKYKQLKESIVDILTPRVTGELKKINNYESFLNGDTYLQGQRYR